MAGLCESTGPSGSSEAGSMISCAVVHNIFKNNAASYVCDLFRFSVSFENVGQIRMFGNNNSRSQ
jgi:hypothetical protein